MTELVKPGDNRIVDERADKIEGYTIQYEYIAPDGHPTYYLAIGEDRLDAEHDWAEHFMRTFHCELKEWA